MGITIKQLKDFLTTLPETFDNFKLVNGDYTKIDEEYHYRIDKPILSFEVDEETKEFCCLHQTEDDIIIIKNDT